MIKVTYMLAKRVDFPGIGVGPLIEKQYDSLFEANIPTVGQVISLQYGTDIGQVGAFLIRKVDRTIWNEHESYMIWVEGA